MLIDGLAAITLQVRLTWLPLKSANLRRRVRSEHEVMEHLNASGYDTDKWPELLRSYEEVFRPLVDRDLVLLELYRSHLLRNGRGDQGARSCPRHEVSV